MPVPTVREGPAAQGAALATWTQALHRVASDATRLAWHHTGRFGEGVLWCIAADAHEKLDEPLAFVATSTKALAALPADHPYRAQLHFLRLRHFLGGGFVPQAERELEALTPWRLAALADAVGGYPRAMLEPFRTYGIAALPRYEQRLLHALGDSEGAAENAAEHTRRLRERGSASPADYRSLARRHAGVGNWEASWEAIGEAIALETDPTRRMRLEWYELCLHHGLVDATGEQSVMVAWPKDRALEDRLRAFFDRHDETPDITRNYANAITLARVADRIEVTLELFDRLMAHPRLQDELFAKPGGGEGLFMVADHLLSEGRYDEARARIRQLAALGHFNAEMIEMRLRDIDTLEEIFGGRPPRGEGDGRPAGPQPEDGPRDHPGPPQSGRLAVAERDTPGEAQDEVHVLQLEAPEAPGSGEAWMWSLGAVVTACGLWLVLRRRRRRGPPQRTRRAAGPY